MLPICRRVSTIQRAKYPSLRGKGFLVARQPKSLGAQLRKRRLELNMSQSEAARNLKVSARSLSLWECDRLYPTWEYWPRIVSFLGFDPFENPALGCGQSNKSSSVAVLAPEQAPTLGQNILRFRMAQRMNRKKFAHWLGISTKTVWGWETNRRRPSRQLWKKLSDLGMKTDSAT